jgi:hypothetical protein
VALHLPTLVFVGVELHAPTVQATEVARHPYPPRCQEHPRIRGDSHEPVSNRQAHRRPTFSVHPILRLVFDRENDTCPEPLRSGEFTPRMLGDSSWRPPAGEFQRQGR